MKYVFIRADASLTIGSGHVMRCLTLADKLAKQGEKVFFVTRDWPGNMAAYIEDKGYPVLILPALQGDLLQNEFQLLAESWQQDAEETISRIKALQPDPGDTLLVVDHYGLDEKWEKALRPIASKIMVIDDLANRPHDCDILRDQNYYKNMEERYRGLVPFHCRMELGPKYALLREEFYHAKKNLRVRNGVVRHLLIFFGGSDPTGETMKALQALERLNRPDIGVDVVVGMSNPYRREIEQFCGRLPSIHYHCQVDQMAELMARADLAVGAGGTATWERCFLGLPTLVITVAENQVEMVRDLAETEAIEYLGTSETVDAEGLAESLRKAISHPQNLAKMSRRALALFE